MTSIDCKSKSNSKLTRIAIAAVIIASFWTTAHTTVNSKSDDSTESSQARDVTILLTRPVT